VPRLKKIWASVRIGDPTDPSTLMGPLVDEHAVDDYKRALERAKSEGRVVLQGGKKLERPGHFVEPTLVRVTKDMLTPRDETFAPILYIYEVDTLEQAIAIQTDVPQAPLGDLPRRAEGREVPRPRARTADRERQHRTSARRSAARSAARRTRAAERRRVRTAGSSTCAARP
jgi:hypothetical protein